MAKYSGRQGTVSIGTTFNELHAHEFSVNDSMAVVDVTDFANAGVREIVASKFSFQGNFSCWADDTAHSSHADQFATVTFIFYTGKETLTGSCVVSGCELSSSHDGSPSLRYSFEGSGALTVT